MYSRRKSTVVEIGNTPIGGDYPIRIQSMTNTSTLDTENSIQQCIRIIEAGGEYVRLTAQGVREAENLQHIKDGLRVLGYQTPLVADIHFNPKAAEAAAQIVEKVRINPGNFAQDGEKIRDKFIPFLHICKKHHTAIRIGVNHGSLSERMMNLYGDTPQGMVESCMEFLRICVEENFTNVVISMKASNTYTMVQSVRLLVETMNKEDIHFPLHLGVTEAGDGEDGRIKSAVGIGTLLLEGIGDTIRVSLSEDPEAEIPVARLLIEHTADVRRRIQPVPELKASLLACSKAGALPLERRSVDAMPNTNNSTPLVVSDRSETTDLSYDENLKPDYFYTFETDDLIFVQAKDNNIAEQKAQILALREANVQKPIILWNTYNETDLTTFQIKAATDCSSFFLDRWADGLMLTNKNPKITPQEVDACAFGILQATGRRISKTEYISCPSCGRTLFDLQTAIKKVKAATSHLKGLKIAIMGCIVNGPGEMADADYGYVGAGVGKVSLYKGKECVLKNIPEETAVAELIKLIEQRPL